MNININDIKNGMTIVIDQKLCQIIEFQHVKPGKGPAFVRIKLKNLMTGSITEDTYNTNIKIEKAQVSHDKVQFLYNTADNYVFMNNETFEQTEVNKDIIKDDIKFLKEGLDLEILSYQGKIISLNFPDKISYKVIECEPAVKGNTVSNAMKDATIETGYTLKVPLFVNQDDLIVVSTKDGKYDSRA